MPPQAAGWEPFAFQFPHPASLRSAIPPLWGRDEERSGNYQCRYKEHDLACCKHQRMDDVVDQAARRRGASLGIGERKEIVLHEPNKVRRHDEKRQRERKPGSGSCKAAPCFAIEYEEKREWEGQHHHEILCPQRQADGEAEQKPGPEVTALERGMEGIARQGP
jgi:hypothetical protein